MSDFQKEPWTTVAGAVLEKRIPICELARALMACEAMLGLPAHSIIRWVAMPLLCRLQ